jgi:hypothetical protein
MYQLASQWLRQTFYGFKRVLYIAFIYFLWKDLSDRQQGVITTASVLAILWAVLIFFNPVVDLLLRVGIIALVVLASLGYCGEPNLFYGICNYGLESDLSGHHRCHSLAACGPNAGGTADLSDHQGCHSPAA